ncbi:hypothetical protein LXL04_032922 [Taraxacum kok-saghyz]
MPAVPFPMPPEFFKIASYVLTFSSFPYTLVQCEAPRSIKKFSDAARKLEEASVSCKGEDRVELLKKWLVDLRESERLYAIPFEIDETSSENPTSPSDKNSTPGKSAMIVYYDPDLGSLPMNFRDVFLQSQALEGITMSMPHGKEVVIQ